jgi:hypothetical protein
MKKLKSIICPVAASIITAAIVALFSYRAHAYDITCEGTENGEIVICIGPSSSTCLSFNNPGSHFDCKGIKMVVFHPDDPE